jgi:hypothetical protein
MQRLRNRRVVLILFICLMGAGLLADVWWRAVHSHPAPVLHLVVSTEEEAAAVPIAIHQHTDDHLLEDWIRCKELQAALHSKGKWTMRNKHLDLRDQSIVHEDPSSQEKAAVSRECEYHLSTMRPDSDNRKCDQPSVLYVDDSGSVCSWDMWDKKSGCCQSGHRRFSCLGCSSEGCCKQHSFCVSCCMRNNTSLSVCQHICDTSSRSALPRQSAGTFPHCFRGPRAASLEFDALRSDLTPEPEPTEALEPPNLAEDPNQEGPDEYLNFDA